MQETNLFSHIKKLTHFAIPVSMSMLVNMLASVAAMFMVSKIGKEELAAGALAVSTYITISMAAVIFYSVGILIGHFRGQEKSVVDIGCLIRSGLWLAFILAIPMAFILWHVNYLLLWFGQDPALVKLTIGYFHFAAFLMFPMLMGSVIAQFMTGMGHPRFNFYISIIILPLIILLSYCFILGKFGFPQLGLSGVSCATLIVYSVVLIIELLVLMLAKSLRHFEIFSKDFLPNWKICQQILILGLPIGLQFGGELSAMAVATYFMGHFGVVPLAAGQIVGQYCMLIVMVFLGLSQAVSVLVSQAYGQKNIILIQQYIKSALIILTLFFIVIFALLFIAPEYLVKVFLNQKDISNTALIHLAIVFLGIACVTLFADGMRNILSSALRGLHDSKAPMMIGLISLWGISLPLSYISGFLLHGGPIGLRVGFMLGFILPNFWLWWRIKQRMRIIYESNI